MAAQSGGNGQSMAGELARLLIETRVDDLPPLALERARMSMASTIASAAMGKGIDSARILRELAHDRGGRPEATVCRRRKRHASMP
jgi:2-methylcitrate dehydratase PrpD